MASVRKVTLISSDGETFEVEEAVALESQTIKDIFEDCADKIITLHNVTSKILSKVIEYCKKHVDSAAANAAAAAAAASNAAAAVAAAAAAANVAANATSVAAAAAAAEAAAAAAEAAAAAAVSISDNADAAASAALKAWDADFVKVDQATLFDLIMAANYLNIKSLLDLTCQTVADMINGKTPDEIAKILNIKNDFTPEEEEKVRRENQWAFE